MDPNQYTARDLANLSEFLLMVADASCQTGVNVAHYSDVLIGSETTDFRLSTDDDGSPVLEVRPS